MPHVLNQVMRLDIVLPWLETLSFPPATVLSKLKLAL